MSKSHRLTVTLNDKEFEMLNDITSLHDCSKSAAVRAMIRKESWRIITAPVLPNESAILLHRLLPQEEIILPYCALIDAIFGVKTWHSDWHYGKAIPNWETVILCREAMEELEQIYPAGAEITKLHFGLEGIQRHTFKSIGIVTGITGERIRQIQARALRILRHPVRSKKLRKALIEESSNL